MTPPKWIKPQLCKLATQAPSGPLWVHEVKFDGYRMAARIASGKVQLLTRTGLDWTSKYPATTAALTKLPVQSAYLDGELCAVRPNGISDISLMQQAADQRGAGLVYYLFDLLELDGGGGRRLAARRAQDPPCGPARLATPRHRLQPPRGRRRRGVSPRRMRLRPRRRHLEAPRPTLSSRRPQSLDQDEMPQPRRIRRRRMGRPRRVETLSWLPSPRLPRRQRASSLRRPSRNRHVAEDARRVARASRPTRCQDLSPSPSRPRARRASAVASRSRASTGSDPFSSPKSPISPGPTTDCSATPSLSTSATISPRARFDESGRPDSALREAQHIIDESKRRLE
jgi:ATP dependent DNA ligase domain